MRVTLVGNRQGNAVINWLGVLAVSGFIAAISLASASIFMFFIGWFSLPTLIMSVISSVSIVVGSGIHRALRLPVGQLTPLK